MDKIDDKIPLCKCGCGSEVKWDKKAKKWNKYIRWHQGKNSSYHKRINEKQPLCKRDTWKDMYQILMKTRFKEDGITRRKEPITESS